MLRRLDLCARFRSGRSRYINNRRSNCSWANSIRESANKVQSFVSNSNNPFINLCIENFLLKESPQDSTVLFLYTNRPCVVIGRNQNPWLEVNLNLVLNEGVDGLGKIDLIRRRSGGGAVFHDEGNVNWTVISPSPTFTRDKHAEMVVRALRRNGIDRARVNERHDIVLDQGLKQHDADADDLHHTAYATDQTVKVSGSAYKLTRGRALHHGTCLLLSPNLHVISRYLHSPAKAYIKSKGVQSVSSTVSNVGLESATFHDAVQKEFLEMYNQDSPEVVHQQVGEEASQLSEIMNDMDEMRSPDWIFGQTPQFTFSVNHGDEDDASRTNLPPTFPANARVYLDVKHGEIRESAISVTEHPLQAQMQSGQLNLLLNGCKLYGKENWADRLEHLKIAISDVEKDYLYDWLDRTLPVDVAEKSNAP